MSGSVENLFPGNRNGCNKEIEHNLSSVSSSRKKVPAIFTALFLFSHQVESSILCPIIAKADENGLVSHLRL